MHHESKHRQAQESRTLHQPDLFSRVLEKIPVFQEKWTTTENSNLCQGGKPGRHKLRLSRLFTSHLDLYALYFQVHLQDRVRHSKYLVFMVQVHPCSPKTLSYLTKLSVKVRRKLFLGEVKIYSQLWECIKAPRCVRSGLHSAHTGDVTQYSVWTVLVSPTVWRENRWIHGCIDVGCSGFCAPFHSVSEDKIR